MCYEKDRAQEKLNAIKKESVSMVNFEQPPLFQALSKRKSMNVQEQAGWSENENMKSTKEGPSDMTYKYLEDTFCSSQRKVTTYRDLNPQSQRDSQRDNSQEKASPKAKRHQTDTISFIMKKTPRWDPPDIQFKWPGNRACIAIHDPAISAKSSMIDGVQYEQHARPASFDPNQPGGRRAVSSITGTDGKHHEYGILSSPSQAGSQVLHGSQVTHQTTHAKYTHQCDILEANPMYDINDLDL